MLWISSSILRKTSGYLLHSSGILRLLHQLLLTFTPGFTPSHGLWLELVEMRLIASKFYCLFICVRRETTSGSTIVQKMWLGWRTTLWFGTCISIFVVVTIEVWAKLSGETSINPYANISCSRRANYLFKCRYISLSLVVTSNTSCILWGLVEVCLAILNL